LSVAKGCFANDKPAGVGVLMADAALDIRSAPLGDLAQIGE
jgi:hypothetical protein